jgi:hypothetical protein
MSKIKDFFLKNEWLLILIFLTFFVLIRLPGTDLPLHQDEYKWPMIVNPSYVSDTEIPHPPLSQFIYRVAGEVVGFDVDFRFVPLFFGAVNLLLLYYLLRLRFSRAVATVGSAIFTLSYFSVLASLMVDTDGQIMPFFFLVALIGYYKSKLSFGRKKYAWLGLTALSLVLGFFIKVSFILAIVAIVSDFFWEKKSYITKNDALKYIGYILGGVVALILLLVVSQYVFSFFDLNKAFEYWKHFAELDRNWFQTGIQVIKALLYTSPFLVLLPLLLSRNKARELRPFIFYLFFGIIFYVVIFDFSIGALDRYLQFFIVPLSAISSVVIVSVFKSNNNLRNKEYLLLGCLFASIMLFLLFIPHFVPSLHPKSAWIGRVLSLKWNFLYPFSGGSGPLGFYVSFLFIALAWLSSLFLVLLGYFKPHLQKMVILVMIPVGLIYNGVFAEEYLFGRMYGSAPKLLNSAVEFIKNNPDIKMVTVYNDNGGNEIRSIGKYRKRLYTDPAFDINEKIATLNTYKEHYLEINVPRIDPNSVYRKYLDSCEIVYNKTDKQVSAMIHDCRKAPDFKK